MRKFLSALILVLIMSFGLFYADAGERLCPDFFITVTTNTTVASRMLPYTRLYYLIINTSTDTVVWHSSTSTVNASNYTTVGAIPININYGFWEDDFYVYKGTWYATVASGSAVVVVREKE